MTAPPQADEESKAVELATSMKKCELNDDIGKTELEHAYVYWTMIKTAQPPA